MIKVLAGALAISGVALLSIPTANAAPRLDGVTQELSAQTVVIKTKKKRHRHRTVVRTYPAPRYYGYYGPTYYERPYHRPPSVVLGVGGWW